VSVISAGHNEQKKVLLNNEKNCYPIKPWKDNACEGTTWGDQGTEASRPASIPIPEEVNVGYQIQEEVKVSDLLMMIQQSTTLQIVTYWPVAGQVEVPGVGEIVCSLADQELTDIGDFFCGA